MVLLHQAILCRTGKQAGGRAGWLAHNRLGLAGRPKRQRCTSRNAVGVGLPQLRGGDL